MTLLPVCILAGGIGSRLGEAVTETPKPLLEVAGKPFIVHQLELLRTHGARQIVVSTGYLGEQFERLLGSGDDFSLKIRYSHDGEVPLGTGGAVKVALPLLGDRFLVLYGDTYLQVNYEEVQERFLASGTLGLLTVLKNQDAWDKSNARVEGDRVIVYDKYDPRPDMRWIDYGLCALSAQAFAKVEAERFDLGDIFGELARQNELAAYRVTERFYEIGTPVSLEETERFLSEHEVPDS